MTNYYQPEIETAPAEQIKRIQDEKIVKQVKHVYENVRYYRNLTQVQTAKLLGITQVKVSRREKKILSVIREKMLG